MRLLIVEDEARIAGFLVKGLTARGYDVDHVERGGDALERACTGAVYELMLLDLGLPDMDGLDVLRRLRARGLSVPVIIYTAHAAERDEAMRLGAAAFLVKPLRFEQLLDSVHEHVG
jgi:two-component system response regulator QseB